MPAPPPQALDDFVMLWAEYDDGSGTIEPHALEEMLLRLDPPLGLGPGADGKDVLKWVGGGAVADGKGRAQVSGGL